MEKKLSRQRAWQLRKRKERRCETCGKPAAEGYRRCTKCVLKTRLRQRKKGNYKARVKYGRGRPLGGSQK